MNVKYAVEFEETLFFLHLKIKEQKNIQRILTQEPRTRTFQYMFNLM
jgi:hypothetical protein